MASIRRTESGKFQARVFINKKVKSLGTFKTKKEAAEAAENFERNMKPLILAGNLKELLQTELKDWQKRIEQFQGLEKKMIEQHIDTLQKTIRLYEVHKEEANRKIIDAISF